jgi:hypothetical protein
MLSRLVCRVLLFFSLSSETVSSFEMATDNYLRFVPVVRVDNPCLSGSGTFVGLWADYDTAGHAGECSLCSGSFPDTTYVAEEEGLGSDSICPCAAAQSP